MPGQDFPTQLKRILDGPLPGWEAQQEMIPEGRDRDNRSDDLQSASVLIALHQTGGEWYFPLIQRSVDGFAHSGQIALPGGRKEGTENVFETALREAHEEVNIQPESVRILGKLSPLPIPVSKHFVQPVVGHLVSAPNLIPDPREVADVFNVSIRELVALKIRTEHREFKHKVWDIPYLEISGHKVWGATAMILSEFRAVLRQIGEKTAP